VPNRAQLASDVANELLFLHDALPGVQKYYEAQNIQNVLYWVVEDFLQI